MRMLPAVSAPVFTKKITLLIIAAILLLALPVLAGAQTAHFSGTAPVNFGTVAIGKTSAATSLTFTFDTGGTIEAPVALTMGAAGLDFAVASGGTCKAGTYSTGASCTVSATFTPKYSGLRQGAVALENASGITIATGYVQGTGSGPQVSFLPGSQITLGGGFDFPDGVAVDGAGNVFVAGYNNSELNKIPSGCTSASCVKTLGGGFGYLAAITLDVSGNIYVADSSDEALKEVPFGCVTSSCVKTLATGFSGVNGIGLDASGNIYVSESGYEGSVQEIPSGCTSSSCAKTLGTFDDLYNIAVDPSGDVFVASYSSVVHEIPAGCASASCVKTLGSGFGQPQSVAVDGSGNVFVADYDNGTIDEILAVGGYTTVKALYSGLDEPWSIAVDGSGNVYVAEPYNGSAVVKLDFADAPALSFATPTAVGTTDTTDGTQTLTVQNIGNAALDFTVPKSGKNPSISTGFILSSSGASACPVVTSSSSAAGTLAAGASCKLPISFEPTAAGAISGSLILTDNAVPATQSIALSGTGLPPAPVVTSLGPKSATAGGAAFLLTINGSGFTATSTVTFGNDYTDFFYIGPNQLVAVIPASEIMWPGPVSVTVQTSSGTSPAATFTVTAPAPGITSLSPGTATAGGSAFVLTITGTNFFASEADEMGTAGDVVKWGSTTLTSFGMGPNELAALVPASLIASAGKASVTVTTTSGTSAAATFTINPVTVTITSLSPTPAAHGGAAFTLTITGANFAPGAAVKWGGSALTTTYVSATKVTASVPASLIAAAGTAKVTVTTAAGGTSAAATFTIK